MEVRRRADQETVEVLAENERHRESLAPAGRAAVPVVARRRRAVIDLGQRERPFVLLVDALDQEVVQRAVVELVCVLDDREARAAGRVAGVGNRAYIAGVRRRGHTVRVAKGSLQAAAADVAHLAVPRALHGAAPAIEGVERKADADADALVLPHRVALRRSAFRGIDEVRLAARCIRRRRGRRDQRREWQGNRGTRRGVL